MAITHNLEVELIEKELINVELAVIDILPIRRNLTDLNDVDINNVQEGQILQKEGDYWVNKNVSIIVDTYSVDNETPIAVNPLPSIRFRTEFEFRPDTLQVFLNGQKIHNSEIIKHAGDQEYSYPLNIIATDKVEVSYIKK